jgi:hypothetical protein
LREAADYSAVRIDVGAPDSFTPPRGVSSSCYQRRPPVYESKKAGPGGREGRGTTVARMRLEPLAAGMAGTRIT